MDEIIFRPFAPGDEHAFRELNEAWITEYFAIEDKDREVLGDPVTHILDKGGHILMAVRDGSAVGCCALLAMPGGGYEVAKMTVAESLRGLGLGRNLLAYAIGHAKTLGARRLYLETNDRLSNALHVYRTMGFSHVPAERLTPSPYARSNIFMEMILE